ncbi:hypothetical protein HDU98_007715 [Podochytrium sp. JEL0797]|nr:hypothetical protein HDU98_007715 [Podochytrium sp. JEL0797]
MSNHRPAPISLHSTDANPASASPSDVLVGDTPQDEMAAAPRSQRTASRVVSDLQPSHSLVSVRSVEVGGKEAGSGGGSKSSKRKKKAPPLSPVTESLDVAVVESVEVVEDRSGVVAVHPLTPKAGGGLGKGGKKTGGAMKPEVAKVAVEKEGGKGGKEEVVVVKRGKGRPRKNASAAGAAKPKAKGRDKVEEIEDVDDDDEFVGGSPDRGAKGKARKGGVGATRRGAGLQVAKMAAKGKGSSAGAQKKAEAAAAAETQKKAKAAQAQEKVETDVSTRNNPLRASKRPTVVGFISQTTTIPVRGEAENSPGFDAPCVEQQPVAVERPSPDEDSSTKQKTPRAAASAAKQPGARKLSVHGEFVVPEFESSSSARKTSAGVAAVGSGALCVDGNSPVVRKLDIAAAAAVAGDGLTTKVVNETRALPAGVESLDETENPDIASPPQQVVATTPKLRSAAKKQSGSTAKKPSSGAESRFQKPGPASSVSKNNRVGRTPSRATAEPPREAQVASELSKRVESTLELDVDHPAPRTGVSLTASGGRRGRENPSSDESVLETPSRASQPSAPVVTTLRSHRVDNGDPHEGDLAGVLASGRKRNGVEPDGDAAAVSAKKSKSVNGLGPQESLRGMGSSRKRTESVVYSHDDHAKTVALSSRRRGDEDDGDDMMMARGSGGEGMQYVDEEFEPYESVVAEGSSRGFNGGDAGSAVGPRGMTSMVQPKRRESRSDAAPSEKHAHDQPPGVISYASFMTEEIITASPRSVVMTRKLEMEMNRDNSVRKRTYSQSFQEDQLQSQADSEPVSSVPSEESLPPEPRHTPKKVKRDGFFDVVSNVLERKVESFKRVVCENWTKRAIAGLSVGLGDRVNKEMSDRIDLIEGARSNGAGWGFKPLSILAISSKLEAEMSALLKE